MNVTCIDPRTLDVDIRDFRDLTETWDSEVFFNWQGAPNKNICGEYERHERGMTTQRVQELTAQKTDTRSVRNGWECLVHQMRSGVPVSTENYAALINRCVTVGELGEALSALSYMRLDGAKPQAIPYGYLATACMKHAATEILQKVYDYMREDGIARNAPMCDRFGEKRESEDNVQRFTSKCIHEATWLDTEACLKAMQKVGLEPDEWVRTAALTNYPQIRLITTQPRQILDELLDLGLLRDLSDIGRLIAACDDLSFPRQAIDLLREAATGQRNILKHGLGHAPESRTIDFTYKELEISPTERYNPKAFQVTVALFNYHREQQAIGEDTLFRVGSSDPNVKTAVAYCMRGMDLAPVEGIGSNGTRNPEWLECGRTAFARCLKRGQFDTALNVLHEISERGFFPTPADCSELIHAFVDAGRYEDAKQVFQKLIISKFEWKVTICNAMIEACERHGYNHDAVLLFEEMLERNVRPNARSYFAVIAACQREGGPLRDKITAFIHAAVSDGTFHSALGYSEAQETSLLEFSANAIATRDVDGTPSYAVSPYFVEAMVRYHRLRGHIDPRKTRLAPDGPEARAAVEQAMWKHWLEPADEHRHMLDEPPLT